MKYKREKKRRKDFRLIFLAMPDILVHLQIWNSSNAILNTKQKNKVY